jgi:hypothetical protein
MRRGNDGECVLLMMSPEEAASAVAVIVPSPLAGEGGSMLPRARMGEGYLLKEKPLTRSSSWADHCALSRKGRGHERRAPRILAKCVPLGSSPRGAPRDSKSASTRVCDALCVAGCPSRGRPEKAQQCRPHSYPYSLFKQPISFPRRIFCARIFHLCFAHPNRRVGGAPRDVRVLGGTPVGTPSCVKDARERAYDAACQAACEAPCVP